MLGDVCFIRYSLVCLCLFAVAGSSLSAAGAVKADYSGLAAESMADVSALGRRLENDPGEEAAIVLVRRRAQEAGATLEIRDFDSLSGQHSYSSIVEACFPGSGSDCLVIMVPLDQYGDGPDGEGAGALALGLAEMRLWGQRRAETGTGAGTADRAGARAAPGKGPSLKFVFVGAERRGRYSSSGSPGLGSLAWVAANDSNERHLAVVYLSINSLSDRIELRNQGRGKLSPRWLYDGARKNLIAAGLDFEIDGSLMQISRLGLVEKDGVLDPFLKESIPAVELRSAQGGTRADPGLNLGRYDRFISGLLASFQNSFPENWDRNYISFQTGRDGRSSFCLPETPYIEILLIFCASVTAGILIYTVVRRKATKLFLRRFPQMLLQIAAIYVAVFGVFFSGRVFSGLEGLIIGSSGFWRLAPRVFLETRIAVAYLVFLAAVVFLLKKNILAKNPYFYEFGSLLLLTVDLLFFSAVMPPFAFYFVWAFICVGLSFVVRRPWVSVVSYFTMYVPVLFLFLSLASDPEYRLYSLFVSPSATVSAVLALAFLPLFIYSVSPILFFIPSGKRARTVEAVVCISLAFLVEGISFARALSASAFNASPFELSESLDCDKGVFSAELSGSRRIGDITLKRGDRLLNFSSKRDTATVMGQDKSEWIAFSQSRASFLGRSSYRIGLKFVRKPDMLSLRLTSSDDINIYDCSLPYRTSIDGKSVDIFVGARPPEPFVLEFTVPRGFKATLSARAQYLEPLVPYSFDPAVPISVSGFELIDTFEVGDR